MKKLFFSLGLLWMVFALQAQDMDCGTALTARKATPPYSYNNLSKSLKCTTGKKYEYDFSLKPGREYRIQFYASTNLNNRMWFQLINTKTGEKIIDLPGTKPEAKKGECVLTDIWDRATEKLMHPFFDIIPEETMNLKLIMDLPVYTYKLKISDADPDLGTEAVYEEITEVRKGCVSIFIQDMAAD